MADDPAAGPDRRDNSAVESAIESLREDVREDIGHLRDDVREDNDRLERRVMSEIAGVRRDQAEFALAHARVHTTRQEETDAEHQVFRQFIRDSELAQARRDGMLGMFRFGLELVSRHSRAIATVILALTGALLALSGAITVTIR
jgi:hypothetical protein